MIKKIIVPAVVCALATPMVSFAGTYGGDYGFLSNFISRTSNFISQLIPLIMAIALLAFLIGLVGYLVTTDEKKKGGWKSFIGFGIVILFVMTAVWGLVYILSDVLQIPTANNNRIPVPGIPTPR